MKLKEDWLCFIYIYIYICLGAGQSRCEFLISVAILPGKNVEGRKGRND